MSHSHQDYQTLHQLSYQVRLLTGISSLLEWDQETYMPAAGAGIRGEQLKALAGLAHQQKTSQDFANALAKLIDLKTGELIAHDLNSAQVAAVKAWQRDYIKDVALPSSFVEEFALLASQAQLVWRQAKKDNAFQQFAPYLDKLIQLARQKAEYLGYEEHPYDALLDLYEPSIKTSEIRTIFSSLRAALMVLLKKIKGAKQLDDTLLQGQFDQAKQLAFGQQLLEKMGYDKNKGRLDLSTHPFSSACHPTDSRITTRIHPTSLISNISVILHEAGHSLYEMGLPVEQYGSPLGEAISLGIHESQSRFWETRIGQSLPFWQYYLPLLKETFKGQLDDLSLSDFYRALNKVEPSFIRVEADEVTYSLHVILRFELEVALIEGTLAVRDLPEAWNAKMQELLGITPASHTEGCLQDIHWSMGAFGYFPTYTLGNLYASHIFTAFAQAHPDWETRVSTGELLFIKEWLQRQVYCHGRRYTSQELLKKITGQQFTVEAYIHYLNNKYLNKQLY